MFYYMFNSNKKCPPDFWGSSNSSIHVFQQKISPILPRHLSRLLEADTIQYAWMMYLLFVIREFEQNPNEVKERRFWVEDGSQYNVVYQPNPQVSNWAVTINSVFPSNLYIFEIVLGQVSMQSSHTSTIIIFKREYYWFE